FGLDLNPCILPWVYSETVNFVVGHQTANSSFSPWIYAPEGIIKVMNIQIVAMHRNEWVENADRWVAGFLEMFEEGCHKMGTAIRDRIQERLRGQLLQNGKGDDDDDEEYYYDDDYYDDEDDDDEFYYDDNEYNDEKDKKNEKEKK
ncbi:hypothetical protein Goari_016766, partial [Gossypium aridum]|nr:hypothetical protein [Gossypium aridum]